MKSQKQDHRVKIAKSIVKFAKAQKIGIDRALWRVYRTGRFDTAIVEYAKSKRIGVDKAWTRIINLVYSGV